MRRILKWIVALGAVGRLIMGKDTRERIVAPGEPNPAAELFVIALLLLATVCAAGFVVVFAADGIGHRTQLQGLTLGLALLFVAWALIVVSKRLVVSEEREEEYPRSHPGEQLAVTQIVRESGSHLTRKKLLGAVAGLAGGTLGLAFIAPVASLGPVLETHRLLETPWRRGRRLVREDNVPVKAADIEEGAFYTAFAEGASHDLLGAPLVVVRLPEADLKLPRRRRTWAPNGIVAYSKVCTHAGCAIALYRKPTFAEVEDRPALICPCHYSTFDPAAGGTVVFGPAGRDLPQLPLQIDPAGNLRAAGNFSGPPGPSWWGVRLWKARFGNS
jgi:ubiquinol-cytochrome c reductase iron-sulfur subunit